MSLSMRLHPFENVTKRPLSHEFLRAYKNLSLSIESSRIFFQGNVNGIKSCSDYFEYTFSTREYLHIGMLVIIPLFLSFGFKHQSR